MTATKQAVLTALFALLLIMAVSFAVVAQNAPTEANTAPQTTVEAPQPPTVEELFTLVNEERAKAGVAPLIMDERLNRSAQQKADDMFINNYNGHVDSSGRHGYDIAHEYAPEICMNPSENLYWGNTEQYPNTSAGAVYWWTTSEAHYKGMVNPSNIYTGFGIAGNKIVQHFCY